MKALAQSAFPARTYIFVCNFPCCESELDAVTMSKRNRFWSACVFLLKLILFCSISNKVRLKIHLELQHSKQLDKQGGSSCEG